MKIIQLIHALNPGGAERLVVDLSNELAKEINNRIFLISLKNRKEKNEQFYLPELSSNVLYTPMDFGDGNKLIYLLKLSNKLRQIKPDIVHIHCQIHYLPIAIFLNPKTKFVYTLHNRPDILLYGIRKYIVKLFTSLGRLKTVTISDTNHHSLTEFLGQNKDSIIYNGRKIPETTINLEKTRVTINGLKKHEDDIVLLSIAKCSKQKNLHLLINSINELVKQGKHISLLIIGDNYQNTDLGKELRSLAGDTTHFLGTKSNVADYFYLCDAFCLSSIFEGMPITLLEAFACGCLPISTPVSGAVDIITDNKTGFISADFSQQEYISTLLRFIELNITIKRKELKKAFIENYSIEKCAKNYLTLFAEIK